ncbi:hypothetical protein MNB_SV-15-289 [hydrothermal vent metagenome]|uniref:DUF3373 domain-containing protein n=1 Tax=hydrothermal vent metagenome TaxID=652676 RepID=A0A1W1EIM7_9ZZZZ
MKKFVTLSIVTASSFAFASTASDIRFLKNEITNLKAQIEELQAKNQKTDKKVKRVSKKLNKVKTHDAKDNIKWSADVRTSMDSINYDMADGSERKNSSLFSTRVWLNMAYAPSSNLIFKGQLAYNKAFGADFGNGRGAGFDAFDWVTNETLTGNDIKLRQAYWLYMGDDFLGTGLGWTASVGRRPSTTGFLSSLREDDTPQSPLSHMIDVEFDGASSMLKLEKLTGISGISIKLCAGVGSTNASPRFSGSDYAEDKSILDDTKLMGVIFVPYDNGEYQFKTMAFRAWDLPGYNTLASTKMSTMGDMDGAVASLLVDGLGDDGYLADVKLFASFAWSKTRPNNPNGMLGSLDDESGTSYWFGVQAPLFSGKFGLEYNHGSEYWRSFTYGEDTMSGSKLAVRGDAFEAYYTKELTKGLSFSIRYTNIDYEYTGSNGFFGAYGTPIKIDDIKTAAAAGDATSIEMLPNIIDEAEDIRAYIRYRF